MPRTANTLPQPLTWNHTKEKLASILVTLERQLRQLNLGSRGDRSMVRASGETSGGIAKFITLAVAFKIEDGGDLFFCQDRVGLGGHSFCIFKLRTMGSGKGKRGIPAHSTVAVTRTGRFLRRFRVDELPQLLNVLMGQMSIVGPRPEQSAIVQAYRRSIPMFGVRHLVKPGITGWSQVHYGYAGNTEESRERLEYDLYYLKHRTFILDVVILIRSVWIVVFGQGSR